MADIVKIASNNSDTWDITSIVYEMEGSNNAYKLSDNPDAEFILFCAVNTIDKYFEKRLGFN